MRYQFRFSRYLAYAKYSGLWWLLGWAIITVGDTYVAFLIGFLVFSLLDSFLNKILDYFAQKHYIKKIQPAFVDGLPDQALKSAEALLSVWANEPTSWESLLIEIHCIGALLLNNRTLEAGRRLEWVERHFAAHLVKNNLSQYWVENQRMMIHLLRYGGERLEPLLERYKDAWAKTRLELQEKNRYVLEFYEATASVWNSSSEKEWETYHERFSQHPKETIRSLMEAVEHANLAKRNDQKLIDPFQDEGDLLPIRRYPQGGDQLVSWIIDFLVHFTAFFGLLQAIGTIESMLLWRGFWMLPMFCLTVYYTLRLRFHEGVQLMIFLITVFLSIQF